MNGSTALTPTTDALPEEEVGIDPKHLGMLTAARLAEGIRTCAPGSVVQALLLREQRRRRDLQARIERRHVEDHHQGTCEACDERAKIARMMARKEQTNAGA